VTKESDILKTSDTLENSWFNYNPKNTSPQKIKINNRWKKAQEAEKAFWVNKKEMNPNYEFYLSLLEEYIKNHKNKNLLDIGSGAVSILENTNGNRYAIDPLMDEFIKNYKLSKSVNHTKGKGEKLPFKDKFFDVIFCINTLDHTECPIKVLKESKRCLKKKGILFLVINCYSKQISLLRKFSERIGAGDIHHPHSYTVEDIENYMDKLGFETESVLPPKMIFNNPPKNDLTNRFSKAYNSRGFFYILKRMLILPLHVIFNKLFLTYDDTIFVYRKF
jgi:2-polyprenyl-3-methyl-5-hydroxy-6-metoxy-1,4-benzoquinol methylase